MALLIDIGIIALICIGAAIGHHFGLIKIAFGLFGFIIAVIVSLLLYKPVATLITSYTPLPSLIENRIQEKLSTETEDEKKNSIQNYYQNFKNMSINSLSHNISNSVIHISSAILVFLIARIIVFFLRFSTEFIGKLPLIKQINHTAGLIYGVLAGFLIAYLIFTIISVLAPVLPVNTIIELINHSIIANIMYHNNIIFLFLV